MCGTAGQGSCRPASRRVTRPLVSIVVPTRNRADDLRQALVSLLGLQPHTADCEFIVVDNGSSDHTLDVLGALATVERRLRILREPRPGISHARNTGIAHARGSIIAFTDDDIRVHADWVDAIVRTFAIYPRAAVVGGRVLPCWPVPPPPWLQRQSWGPLAIVDYGPEQLIVDRHRPLCLVGANVAMRASAFDEIGHFSPAFPRGQDQQWLERLFERGGFGVYMPAIAVSSPISPERLEKQYHRRWHYGRGRFLARMRLPRLEATRTGRLFDVPAHMWRSCARETLATILDTLLRRRAAAFHHLCAALCDAGFIRERVGDRVAALLPPPDDAPGPLLAGE
jgi:glycosyltransferase involved in cell wall biosynthesis